MPPTAKDVLTEDSPWGVEVGDCLTTLSSLPDQCVQCVVTSPPYFGLRDYGIEPTSWPEISFSPMAGIPRITIPDQTVCLGQETDPYAYVGHLIHVFREIRRVFRKDGTVWLNLGDCYARDGKGTHGPSQKHTCPDDQIGNSSSTLTGLPQKSLMGIPWRVAFALQGDGWVFRSDVVWEKSNPLPEPVKDRPARSHEFVFLLGASPKYKYNYHASRVPVTIRTQRDNRVGTQRHRDVGKATGSFGEGTSASRMAAGDAFGGKELRNGRDVWKLAVSCYKGAHFAVMPERLAEMCILAGTGEGDIVLDPFGGSGTVAVKAMELGRRAILCEKKVEYTHLMENRVQEWEAQGLGPNTEEDHALTGLEWLSPIGS